MTIHQPATAKANGSFDRGERTIRAAPATILRPCSVRFSRQLDAANFAAIAPNSRRQRRGRSAISTATANSQRPAAVTMMRAAVCILLMVAPEGPRCARVPGRFGLADWNRRDAAGGPFHRPDHIAMR